MRTIGVHETGDLSGILDWERVYLIRLARFHSASLGRFLRGASEIIAEVVEPRLEVGDEVVA